MPHGSNQPVVIKKVKKAHGHGHHGGAWKVAYADFVTAMMAFFLLLWLLAVTTEEQKLGLANYFLPTPNIKAGEVGSTGFTGGHALDETGQLNAPPRSSPSVMLGLPPEQGTGDTTHVFDFDGLSDEEPRAQPRIEARRPAELQAERAEEAELRRVTRELRRAIAEDPGLAELGRNLMVDRTPEGVRIQIFDQEERSMFPLGSATMYPHMRALMAKVVKVIEGAGRRIAITGHTDATPFRPGSDRDNWQLSAERANASRRALIEAGLPAARVDRVVGKADTDPLDPDRPTAAENRRIGIVLLRPTPPDDRPAASGGLRPLLPLPPPGR